MRRPTLSQRVSLAFALLLLACCAASAWLQLRMSERHEQEVIQRLSRGLAGHIAQDGTLIGNRQPNAPAVKILFDKLMDVNPSVEVYLLDLDGRVLAHAAPPGAVRRERVDVEPIRRLLAGQPLPIVGDDPRSDTERKVFSAAPLREAGREAGFVYVILLGQQHASLARHVTQDDTLRTMLWAMALVTVLGLVAGLVALRLITRPLVRLTADVARFGIDASQDGDPRHDAPPTRSAQVRSPPGTPELAVPAQPTGLESRDEITTLQRAFDQLTTRVTRQWQQLAAQDRQRRELVANISHDLRTPLTSLHGYLETLRLKAGTLSDAERQRYLDVAIGQSLKVGRLAQSLFELARLEYGDIRPQQERFSLPDLVQDVFQKFELAAEARRQTLVPVIAPDLPRVTADVGLIERVLTNLLDNAIRHSGEGSRIEVRLCAEAGGVAVEVGDSGPGFSADRREQVFERPVGRPGSGDAGGGLGLLIVQRILQLHGSEITLMPPAARGAVFRFRLGVAG